MFDIRHMCLHGEGKSIYYYILSHTKEKKTVKTGFHRSDNDDDMSKIIKPTKKTFDHIKWKNFLTVFRSYT